MTGSNQLVKLPTRVIRQNIEILSSYFSLNSISEFQDFMRELLDKGEYSKGKYTAIIRAWTERLDPSNKPMDCCIISVFSDKRKIVFQAPMPAKISFFSHRFFRFPWRDHIF